jgi:CubicO group peptidase (beta-lactamase class C family)
MLQRFFSSLKDIKLTDLLTKRRLYESVGFGPGYKIEGFVAPGFEKVRDDFIQLYKDHWEVTSQLSVFHHGVEVVNLYGMVDGSKTDDHNITPLFSSGKVIESLCMMLLVQRGILKYEDKISKYWPEFAQNGKEDITI